MSSTRTRKKTDLTWTQVSTTTIKSPRPRPSDLHPSAPHPELVVTQLIDSLGRHWERYGDDPPVMLGTPPTANEKDG